MSSLFLSYFLLILGRVSVLGMCLFSSLSLVCITRSLQWKINQVWMRILIIDQINALIWGKKSDQLLFLYIAVNRFLEHTIPLDWFLKHTSSLVQFSVGEIELLYQTWMLKDMWRQRQSRWISDHRWCLYKNSKRNVQYFENLFGYTLYKKCVDVKCVEHINMCSKWIESYSHIISQLSLLFSLQKSLLVTKRCLLLTLVIPPYIANVFLKIAASLV